MARTKRMRPRNDRRSIEFKECCGEVCDERCRELSARGRAVSRRVSSGGALRIS